MSDNDGTKPLNYSANDWFYLKKGAGSACDSSNRNPDPKCAQNEKNVKNLTSQTDTLGAAITQYNDTKVLYNRELLFTINIFVGLGFLIYYIYVNGDALPKLGDAASKLGGIQASMTGLAKSTMSKVPVPAIKPPVPA
jgi:hypothetical protein